MVLAGCNSLEVGFLYCSGTYVVLSHHLIIKLPYELRPLLSLQYGICITVPSSASWFNVMGSV